MCASSEAVCKVQLIFVVLDDGTLGFAETLKEKESMRECATDELRKYNGGHLHMMQYENKSCVVSANFSVYFLNMTEKEQKAAVKIIMQPYKDSDLQHMPAGIPVAFQANIKDKMYHMCCIKEGPMPLVKLKEGPAPETIPNRTSSDIFYLRSSVGKNCFKFESATNKGYFLSVVKEEQDYYKLVLKRLQKSPDETVLFDLTDP
ncbi:interleukin-18-like [Latimeria chalumnae]|uniref:interleukin-18-like n=1 Tax=Latimeria chalumnae TaxID=7897 RepID=UPI00313E8B9E